MNKLLKYISPYKWPMLLGLFLKFVAAMLDLMIPYLLERIIDKAAPTGKPWTVLLCGGVMIVCAIAAILTNVTANRMATYNSGKVTRRLRHDLFAKVSYLSAKQTDEFTVSSLISRITTDTYNFNNMLVRVQRLGVRSPFLLIGGICITMTLDPVLTLVLMSMLPIIAIVVFFVTKYSVPIYTHCQRILDRLVRVVQENATGVRVIKALSKSEHERKRFDAVNEELAEEDKKAGAIMAVTNPVATVVLNLGLTLVVIAGAHRVNSGLTEPGTIIAFLSYFTIILNAMLGITRIFVVCSKGVASADRIAEMLETEEQMPVLTAGDAAQRSDTGGEQERRIDRVIVPGHEPDKNKGTAFGRDKYDEPMRDLDHRLGKDMGSELTSDMDGDVRASSRPYHIEMEHVCFSYNKVRNNLTDIDFRLERGQTLGIIGPTGSGKSTIINLLIRFYDPDSGVIRIDGRDIRTMEKGELCKRFGIAFQNDFIMANTIRENISFGRGLTDEQINRAIVLAQAKEMLDGLKEGLDYGVTARGTNVSGGQKQRLTIARAVAAKPEILVLDDSSSALDYKTDAQLRKALREALPDTTSIIVAQRISSIMNADLILMLDDGVIIGRGTHAELMQSCDEYRMIADTQMGGNR